MHQRVDPQREGRSSRSSMSARMQRLVPAAELSALLLAALMASTCGSSNSAPGGGGGDPPDIPPSITALPGGGAYPGDVLVTLASNEPATVYYTTDGSTPAIGGTTTQSGPAPVTGISIPGQANAETARTLKYFGVDAQGNVGPLLAEEYLIDELVPQVSQQGTDPAPIGILDDAVITWAATDDGTFAVELGGDGTLGNGLLIDSGVYTEAGAAVQTEVAGSLLSPEAGEQPVYVHVTDEAGNAGSATLAVSLRGFAFLDVPAEVVVAQVVQAPGNPSANRLYVAAASGSELHVVDTATGATADVALGCEATGLAVLADGSRAFVGCANGIVVVDAAALAVDITIPVPNSAVPTGLAATVDGARVYFGSSDGIVLYVDTASEQVLPTTIIDFPIETCRIAITPLPVGSKGVVAWKGSGLYGVFVFDAATGTLIGSAISPTPLSPPGDVAVSSSMAFERGFVGDFLNRIARINLASPALEQFVFDSALWGVSALPGNELLLLTHPDDFQLEFRSMQDLSVVTSYDLTPSGLPPSVLGLGLPIAIERIVEGNVLVTRAYVVLELGLNAQLVRVPLSSFVF